MSDLPTHTERSAERERLLDELAHYVGAWLDVIIQRKADFARERGLDANAVMVPPGFAAVAADSTIAGLAVITPMHTEDYALDLPYVCYTILPKEVR